MEWGPFTRGKIRRGFLNKTDLSCISKRCLPVLFWVVYVAVISTSGQVLVVSWTYNSDVNCSMVRNMKTFKLTLSNIEWVHLLDFSRFLPVGKELTHSQIEPLASSEFPQHRGWKKGQISETFLKYLARHPFVFKTKDTPCWQNDDLNHSVVWFLQQRSSSLQIA